MGIMRMRRDFAQHLKVIMWIILGVFVIGIPLSAVYFGGGSFAGLSGNKQISTKNPGSDVIVATVSGEPITAAQLDAAHTNLLAQQAQQAANYSMSFTGGRGIPLSQVLYVRNAALQQVANNAAIVQTARKRGLTASNDEVDAEIARQVDMTIKSLASGAKAQKQDPLAVYRQFMQKNGEMRARVSEDEFREWMTNFANERSRNEVQQSVLVSKLQQQTISSIRVTDSDVTKSFDEVKLDTIIVSLKSAGAAGEATAQKEADSLYVKLKSGKSFAAVKKEAANGEPSSGEPQWVSRSTVSGTFGSKSETAVFALSPNSFSAPVKLPGAFVIFQVTGKRHNEPKDLVKKRAEIRKSLLLQRQGEAWREAESEITKNVKIESKSAQVTAIQDYAAGKTAQAYAGFIKAIDQDAKYIVPGDVYVAMCMALAQDRQQKKKYDEAELYYKKALNPEASFPQEYVTGFPDQIYLALGQLALEQKRTAEALRNFQLAGDGEDFIIHMSLLSIYKKMGQTKLVTQEQQWLDELRQVQKEQQEAEAKYQQEMAAEAAKEKAAELKTVTTKAKTDAAAPKDDASAPKPSTTEKK